MLLGFAVALSLSGVEAGAGLGFSDTINHAVGYCALASAWLMAAVWFPVRGAGRFASDSAAVTVAVISVGFVLEIAQGFVGRDVEGLDAVANVVGSICGFGVWVALRKAFERKSSPTALP